MKVVAEAANAGDPALVVERGFSVVADSSSSWTRVVSRPSEPRVSNTIAEESITVCSFVHPRPDITRRTIICGEIHWRPNDACQGPATPRMTERKSNSRRT